MARARLQRAYFTNSIRQDRLNTAGGHDMLRVELAIFKHRIAATMTASSQPWLTMNYYRHMRDDFYFKQVHPSMLYDNEGPRNIASEREERGVDNE